MIAEFDYAHPIFDAPAIAAQRAIAALQGTTRTWLAGAWGGYGFHEDGLVGARGRRRHRRQRRRARSDDRPNSPLAP